MQMTWSGESILNANRSTPIRAFSRNPQPNSGSYIPLPPFLCVSKVWVSISADLRDLRQKSCVSQQHFTLNNARNHLLQLTIRTEISGASDEDHSFRNSVFLRGHGAK
jgi:hypothetical protein